MEIKNREIKNRESLRRVPVDNRMSHTEMFFVGTVGGVSQTAGFRLSDPKKIETRKVIRYGKQRI
jgi:hypothetical protein